MSDVAMILERCVYALGNAVVQSLWQCALIGALAAAVLIGVRRVTARYAIWCAALALCAAWFAVTFVSGMDLRTAPLIPAGLGGGVGLIRPIGGVPEMTAQPRGIRLFEGIALLWALGFMLVGARVVRQWGSALILGTRGVHEATGAWAALYAEVRASLGVSARVRMLVSDAARSPMVVGWLTPTVVVPMSVLTMMSPDQVRLVLAHELAHIRRHDHVVNMLQVLIETVMFYHPVVWWMSHQARVEREHCCDDAAVRCGGDAFAFARALTELEEVRTRSRAVLALNQGGSLMSRIRRLLDDSDARRGSGSMRVLAALSAAALIAGAAYAHTAGRADGGDRDDARTAAHMDPSGGPLGSDVLELMRINVVSGALGYEQALAIYDRAVRPEYEEQLGLVKQQTRRAIDDGQFSEEDGLARIEAEQEGITWEIESRFLMGVYGMDWEEAETAIRSRRLDAAVAHERIIGDGRAFGVPEEALRARAQDEQAILFEHVSHLENQFCARMRSKAEAGEITEQEAESRILEAYRGARVKAIWWSIERMYQSLVDSGEMAVEEANALFSKVRAERANFRSVVAPVLDEAAVSSGEGGTLTVTVTGTGPRIREPAAAVAKPGAELTIWLDPDGKPADPAETRNLIVEVEGQVEPKEAPLHQEGKLTPMDEAYWHHQGIRSLSAYDESVEGC